jgi:hypothetical protein
MLLCGCSQSGHVPPPVSDGARRNPGRSSPGLAALRGLHLDSGDLAYSVGYEQAEVSIDGGPMRPWKLRVTHIYRRGNDQWKIVHRHADLGPEDQARPDNVRAAIPA